MKKKNKKDWINYQGLYKHLKNEKRELKNMDIHYIIFSFRVEV